jgi:hypothetical protein
MTLTSISFKTGNLLVTVEANSDDTYSVDIARDDKEGNPRYENVARFRTDEVSIDNLIEALQFAKSYKFVQD